MEYSNEDKLQESSAVGEVQEGAATESGTEVVQSESKDKSEEVADSLEEIAENGDAAQRPEEIAQTGESQEEATVNADVEAAGNETSNERSEEATQKPTEIAENVLEEVKSISESVNSDLNEAKIPDPETFNDTDQLQALSDDDIEVDVSSDSESESSSSDSSSESDSDSEFDAEDDQQSVKSDDEEEQINGPIISKHEVLDEKAPTLPDDYTIDENAPIELIGEIKTIVDGSIVIKGTISGEFRVLKENSVLCLQDKTVLGPLFEIFGRLQSPIFRIKYNDHEKAEKFREFIGHKVYYVVPESEFVLTDSIKSIRGTDASNCHDEEVPEEEQEYSDDEQEQHAKQSKKKKRKAKDTDPQKKRKQDVKPVFQPYGYADTRIPAVLNKQNQSSQPYVQPGLQTLYPPQSYYSPSQPFTQPQPQYGQNPNAYGSVPQNQYPPFNQFQQQPQYNPYPNQNQHQPGPINPYQPQGAFQPTPAYVPAASPANYGQYQQVSQPVDPTAQLDNLNPEQLQQLKQMLINQLQQQGNNNETS